MSIAQTARSVTSEMIEGAKPCSTTSETHPVLGALIDNEAKLLCGIADQLEVLTESLRAKFDRILGLDEPDTPDRGVATGPQEPMPKLVFARSRLGTTIRILETQYDRL